MTERRTDGSWNLGRTATWIGWLMAVTLLAATVIFFLLAFDVTAPPPKDVPGNDFVAQTVADFQNEQERWPQELTSSILLGIGFVLLLPMGLILGRAFGRDDIQALLGSAALGVAGIVGAVAQLVFVGAKEVAIDPRYCQCEYAPEQIISQHRALAMAEGAQRWMAIGFLVLLAVGLFLFGRLALQRGAFGRAWASLVLVGAGISLVGVVAAAFQYDPLFELVLAAGAGVLLPIWGVLTGRQLSGAAQEGSHQTG
jgi:MFS family permease